MFFSDGFWIILLIISITYNLYFLVQVRRYQARLKYLKKDNENFLNNTDDRITDHYALIKEVRAELKTLDLDCLPNSEVLTSQEKK